MPSFPTLTSFSLSLAMKLAYCPYEGFLGHGYVVQENVANCMFDSAVSGAGNRLERDIIVPICC